MSREESLLTYRLTLAFVLICTIAIVVLLVGGFVLIEDRVGDVQAQLDHIDSHFRAPESTATGVTS